MGICFSTVNESLAFQGRWVKGKCPQILQIKLTGEPPLGDYLFLP